MEPPPAEPIPVVPRPMVAADRMVEPTPRRRGWLVPALWAASVLILVGLGAGAVLSRDSLKAAWPPSQRLYGALGL